MKRQVSDWFALPAWLIWTWREQRQGIKEVKRHRALYGEVTDADIRKEVEAFNKIYDKESIS